MLFNYEVVVSHIEHDFVAWSQTDGANKPKRSHTVITSVQFLKFMHFLPSHTFQLDY
jgi:hypothetical protein